jgi:hypothetical protein
MAISIDPKNRGKFTESAKRSGQSVQAHAASVLKPGSGASTKEKRRANFARNAKKWNKGGRKKSRSKRK